MCVAIGASMEVMSWVAIDDELLLNECLQSGYQCPNDTHEKPCRMHAEMGRLQNLLVAGMKEKTLDQIL